MNGLYTDTGIDKRTHPDGYVDAVVPILNDYSSGVDVIWRYNQIPSRMNHEHQKTSLKQ